MFKQMLKAFYLFINQKMNNKLYIASYLFFSILTYLLLSTILKTIGFYYDSSNYFYLADDFFAAGDRTFSFANYHDFLRGYTFPLILVPVKVISKLFGGNDVSFYNIFASIAHPLFIVIVIPSLIKKIFLKDIRLYMIISFYFMIIFFHYGLIVFPLSDLWAIYFLCLSLLIIKTSKLNFMRMILAGISLGLTCNIRPIYLCILPLVLAYPIILDGYLKRKIISIAIIIIGVFFAWVPQIIINKANFDTYSPLIQTQIFFEGSLYFTQINLGFAIEKYETNIGNPPAKASIEFYNRKALTIVEKENLPKDKPFENLSSVFTLFTKYPLDFFSIYLNHLFNGIDNKYPEIYISNFYENRWWIYFLNYTVVFVAIYLICINYKYIFKSWENILLVCIVLLPVAMVIPTQVETRFFLPLHLLFYVVCCFCNYPKYVFSKERDYSLPILFSLYILFVVFCFYFSNQKALLLTS